MSNQQDPNLLRRWHEMNSREQLVWSGSFAAQADPNMSAFDKALSADKDVSELRKLNVDNDGASRPEYEIGRSGLNITYAEFAPWYRIAVRITRVGRSGINAYDDVTDEECREAFDRHQQSLSAFS